MPNTVYAVFQIIENRDVRKQDSIKILLGRNIKRYRTELKMTQNEFADAVSCDVKYLGDVENGWFYPSSELLERIIDFLHIPVCFLFVDCLSHDVKENNTCTAVN